MLKKIAIILSYVLSAIIVIGGTSLLVAYGKGYSYDLASRKFVSNGLLLIETQPSNAQLSIDGRQQRHRTPYRSTIRVGNYKLDLHKDGYRDWHKTVEIAGSEVTDLASVILVPNTIHRDTVDSSTNVTSTQMSADRKHAAYVTGGDSVALWQLDIDGRRGNRVFTPVAATADTPAEQIQNYSLSRDGSHALVATKTGESTRVVLVDMGNGGQTDLSATFGGDLTGVRFSDTDWRQLFWNSPDGLRRIDVPGRTISSVLASKVQSYTVAGNHVFMVQTSAVGNTLRSMNTDGSGVHTIVEGVAASDSYQLAYAKYRDRDLLAVVPSNTGKLTMYQGVFSDNPTSRLVARDVTNIVMSTDGRYCVFVHANGFGSIDEQRGTIVDNRYTAKVDTISWFNASHVIVNSGGHTQLVEADGDNATDLVASPSSILSIGLFDQHRIVAATPVAGKTDVNQLVVIDLRK